MANYYGNDYNPTTKYGSAQLDDGISQVAIPGRMGGRMRMKISRCPIDVSVVTTNDVTRICAMKTSDILLSLKLSTKTAGLNTGNIDLGFWQLADENGVGGAEVDQDLIATAYAGHLGAIAPADQLFEVDTDWSQIGMTNWERNGDTSDPCETWDLAARWAGDVDGADETIIFLVEYIAT